VEGLATVESIRINQNAGNETANKSVTLQLVKMGLQKQENKVSLRDLAKTIKQ